MVVVVCPMHFVSFRLLKEFSAIHVLTRSALVCKSWQQYLCIMYTKYTVTASCWHQVLSYTTQACSPHAGCANLLLVPQIHETGLHWGGGGYRSMKWCPVESAKGEQILGVVKEPSFSSLASMAFLSYMEILVDLWYRFPLDVSQADGTSIFLGVTLF